MIKTPSSAFTVRASYTGPHSDATRKQILHDQDTKPLKGNLQGAIKGTCKTVQLEIRKHLEEIKYKRCDDPSPHITIEYHNEVERAAADCAQNKIYDSYGLRPTIKKSKTHFQHFAKSGIDRC